LGFAGKLMSRRLLHLISSFSLRTKVAVIIVIPIMLAFFALSIIHYVSARGMVERQVELTAVQLGEVLLGSLRHGMLANDPTMLQSSLHDLGGEHSLSRVWILDLEGRVKVSSNPQEEGSVLQTAGLACAGCHQYSPEVRPRVLRMPAGEAVLRVSTPIINEQACQGCHAPTDKVLGDMLIDVSVLDIERNLLFDLRRNLVLSTLFSILIGSAVYFLINRMIVRRIEGIHGTLAGYSEGDFSARVTEDDRQSDEIAMLGKTFNQMADQLQQREVQLMENTRVRENAIVEERDRIARELHDGIAQFLGYVSTKSQAARIFLEKGLRDKVDEYLRSIEDEARKQSIDVRASILGLKMFSSPRRGLANDVRDCIDQSNRFMDLEVVPQIDQSLEELSLAAETELQLLRILQEAVSNVRKHSQARKAWVRLALDEGSWLEMSVHDDGIGFEPQEIGQKEQPQFGIATMRERSEAIGASFEITSGHDQGTTVSVRLKLPGQKP
jgi:signal transduction histidine kinase